MDVSFWGPSGWELFHAVSLERGRETEKRELFSVFQYVLPCKYCRQSTRQFVAEMPIGEDVAYWLYKIHDRVNKKLLAQGFHPNPTPTFQEAINHYKHQITNPKLGWDFLYSIALNYNAKLHNKKCHRKFWIALKQLYPRELRVPRMGSSREYFTDVHSMLGDTEPLRSVYARILSHKSKCAKKTCRKTRRKRFKD